jgi:hypothetical protein
MLSPQRRAPNPVGGTRSSRHHRAGRHSLLAARPCRARFPRGRVLAIRSNQGSGLAPQAKCDRTFSERVSFAADRSDARRLHVGHRRTSLSGSARHRAPDAAIVAGAPFHDGGDRDLRLPRRVADTRRVGHLFSSDNRPRTWRGLAGLSYSAKSTLILRFAFRGISHPPYKEYTEGISGPFRILIHSAMAPRPEPET